MDPGIRFVLFMQGCSLRCKYCHNKDMYCINGGKEYSPEQIINEVLKYKNYYNLSGGGLTVSGGEPTLQCGFLTELFSLAKSHNIHTCLDTSGHVDINTINPVLDNTDLVLLDIKQMNKKKCIELTGKSPEKTLLLAQYLNERNIPVWIRYVLVPTVTDDRIDLENLGRFLNILDNVENLEILPYHTMGKFKWQELGLKYELEGIREANEDDVKRALNIINSKRECIL